jgi:hypothetical protein
MTMGTISYNLMLSIYKAASNQMFRLSDCSKKIEGCRPLQHLSRGLQLKYQLPAAIPVSKIQK